MRYLRPIILQPDKLKSFAQKAWINYVIRELHAYEIRKHRIKKDISINNFCDVPFETKTSKELIALLNLKLPVSLQEELFHVGVHIIKQTEVNNYDRVFTLFFECFWHPDFSSLHLPMIQEAQQRLIILENILARCEEKKPKISTLKYRLHDVKSPSLSIEESYTIKRVLRTFTNLNTLLLWKVCDDATLYLIGNNCKHLTTLDVWRSTNVSNQGIAYLISEVYFETLKVDESQRNPLCRTITKVVIKV